METRRKVAMWIFGFQALVGLTFGVIYLVTSRLLPYHERHLGIPFDALPPGAASLYLLLYRAAGIEALLLAGTAVLLIAGPFRRGEIWAWRILGLITLGLAIPMVFVARAVGDYAPWYVYLGLGVTSVIALILGKPRQPA